LILTRPRHSCKLLGFQRTKKGGYLACLEDINSLPVETSFKIFAKKKTGFWEEDPQPYHQ